jgi:hypothetical protein
MATTTPNFGWPVPTSSDLVKNGATAIEGLGDAIDASLLDLKGGTTNQVLAKNSNTDMDFKWVSDATGMTNPMTTTGDTIYSSSGSTPARLGIGTAGQVLRVNSGATAPEWATPAGGGKVLQVVQGTSTTTTSLSSTSYTDTTLTASITPSSASSQVLCLVMLSLSVTATVDGNGHGAFLRLMRGATAIVTNGRALLLSGSTANDTLIQGITPITYLDSPATTSATTYKVQFACDAASTTIFAQIADVPSTIVLLEIGA